MSSRHVSADDIEDLTPDEMGPTYAPRPRPTTISQRLDDEVLLIDGRTGRMHVLNSSAAIIWECLDGSVTLEELAVELAEAFGADRETVLRDTMTVAREVAARGLLDGVSLRLPGPAVAPRLEVGARVETFPATDRAGALAELPGPGVKGSVLVNWSPFCGYCSAIVSQLDECLPSLTERGIELSLLSVGTPADHDATLGGTGLDERVRYRMASDELGERSVTEPFQGMGTPAAYLLDADGIVTAELAMGAGEVPKLVRAAAGLPPATPETASSSLPVASGMCGPATGPSRKPSRQWAGTVALAVGDEVVGVRVDSAATEQVVRAGFEAIVSDDTAPPNFSLVLAPADGASRRRASELNLLLVADRTVLRSRSPQRALQGLAAHLSYLAQPPESQLVRTSNPVGVLAGRAVLLPAYTARWLEHLQPRLAALGVALSDEPEALVDAVTAELVIREPVIEPAAALIESLPPLVASRTELPCVPPGRYPIAAWLLDEEPSGHAGRITKASAIAGALPAVRVDPETVGEVVELLGQLFKVVQPVALPSAARPEAIQNIEAVLRQL